MPSEGLPRPFELTGGSHPVNKHAITIAAIASAVVTATMALVFWLAGNPVDVEIYVLWAVGGFGGGLLGANLARYR